jgi:DNA-binding response OmpR family regulator
MPEKIRVLMVDDEQQFRITTSRILSRRGYETTVAGSGEEAIEILKKSPQDVVILDIKMPGMDGHQTLAEIKNLSPDVKVIMLTGHGGIESARESLKYGAFDYLSKPCEIDVLASRIKDAYLARHGEEKAEKNAGDIMIPIEDYTTIASESTVKEGIDRLKASFRSQISTSRIMETGHRSILVFDKAGELVGILSIRDLIAGIRPEYLSAPKPSMADSMVYSSMFWTGLFTSQAKKLAKKKIGEMMSEAPPEVEEDTNLMELADRMYREGIRRMAVTRKGKVVGVVREQEIFFEMDRIISGI